MSFHHLQLESCDLLVLCVVMDRTLSVPAAVAVTLGQNQKGQQEEKPEQKICKDV